MITFVFDFLVVSFFTSSANEVEVRKYKILFISNQTYFIKSLIGQGQIAAILIVKESDLLQSEKLHILFLGK